MQGAWSFCTEKILFSTMDGVLQEQQPPLVDPPTSSKEAFPKKESQPV